jgi:DNA-binding MarR family transcriptional regulator
MEADEQMPRLDNQLCFALYRASRAIIRAYGPILEPLGLTYPQYLVMLALWQNDRQSVRDIGAKLSLDSATLTPLLKKLEVRGLVTRTRSEKDERVVDIALTKKGQKLRESASAVPVDLACRLGVDVTDKDSLAEIRGLRETLTRLAAGFERRINE